MSDNGYNQLFAHLAGGKRKRASSERAPTEPQAQPARCALATCSLSPELRRLVEAATDFIHNVERHHVAGWGDCGPSVDASFREMRSALRAVTENVEMTDANRTEKNQ